MQAFFGFLAGLAFAALLVALWMRRFWLRPLAEISETAERLARGEHAARAGPRGGSLGRLASSINLLAERFQHDIRELKRLESLRKEFVANASHELRTPLASIKAFAETLGSGAVEEPSQRLEFAREIESNAERMSRLVDELLDLSALESGRMPPNFEPLSLMRVAAEAAASLKPLASKKRTVLRVEPFHNIPNVRADRGQMRQVFINLIDNAVKFSPEKATVLVSAAAQNGTVTVSVQDNGPGIPAQDLPRLFERFYRVDKARARELGGAGLGLAIVKHIVEGHGGCVSVDSEPGQGSSFRFSLPAA